MPALGVPELVIILVIVVVIFGASRLAGIGSALGSSVRDFRQSVREDPPPSADPDARRDDGRHAVGHGRRPLP